MKKMLLVLSLALVLPYATLAHASNIVGGTDANIVGGTDSSIVGGTDATSASWVSVLWQGLVSIVGGTD
ncbi:MAG: hypothetical protein ACLPXT_05420 [Terracidiphilus sp.]